MSQSLIRAIKLLDCFDEKQELSLLELVEISKMPKTTVFRLINSLEQAGLLVKIKYTSHDVKYKMGLKLLELGKRVSNQLEYREIALQYMRELNEKLNESVHLAVMEGDEAVYVEKIDSNKPIRIVVKIGGRAPLYAGSASKILLASLSKQKRNEYISKLNFKKITENTIGEIEKLNKELDEIKEKGYAFSQSEIYKDTFGFSCPIFDNTGATIAALGISIPATEYSEDKGKNILNEIRNTAEKISTELGYK